ncbi:MAG: hypothetical protein EXX96DRAFT_536277 [Benjaminiella poitrasii]|nr:MAG: hypothetical protein EXX96DRAFT_536277 [Benjaminiella poitrasii]
MWILNERDSLIRMVIMFIRQVTFRVQLFVNSTVINNSDLSIQLQLCDGNFWYSICQLIMRKDMTNKNYVDHYVALAVNDTRQQFPSIVYPLSQRKIKRYSDPLAAACKTLATTYLNHLIENMKKHLKYYLYLKINKIYKDHSKQNPKIQITNCSLDYSNDVSLLCF